MTVLTHTSLETFKTCRCKYKYRYIDRICPIERKAALEFGSQMHLILQHLFEMIEAQQTFKGDGYDSKESVTSQLCQMIDIANMEAVDRAKLKGLIIGYIQKWYDSDCYDYDVIDVEREFYIKSDNCICTDFSGKVDGILKRKSDGKYFILEHKTASAINDDFMMQKDIDSQTMTYAVAIQKAMDIEISGAIHDILKKQQIRLKKGETEEDFCQRLIDSVDDTNFTRIIVDFNEGELSAFKDELIGAINDVASCKNFYKCTGQCLGKFGACEYLPLCRAHGNLMDLGDMYEIRKPFEELNNEVLEEGE